MKTLFAAIALSVFAVPAHADSDTPDMPFEITSPQALPVWQPDAATEIRFNVLRKGKPFGQHIVSFQPLADGGFQAINDVDLKAKLGPITVYSYSHDSVETWQDGKLIGLEGRTRKEGKTLEATAIANETGLAVTGTNFNGTYRPDIVPASHWNIAQLFNDKMLSTEGGQLLDANVVTLGRDIVTINGEQVEATKFQLESDLTVFLWYDDQGRWIKLGFTARGQDIEYVLEERY